MLLITGLLIGFAAGFMSGMFGIGGGSIREMVTVTLSIQCFLFD